MININCYAFIAIKILSSISENYSSLSNSVSLSDLFSVLSSDDLKSKSTLKRFSILVFFASYLNSYRSILG